ncbi:MAG: Rab-GTPase [Candidatus Improbicoccus pseudotrichonymphae]|uniref:Rab-GTPase n=1 Tax=Candidatus Improbicoccus pseudotrichonymphae TaxID=3033792 RepID=A0AA48HVQ7_9FIRM|nr:MAG: Rab-GTPase [Candidatus Improbicoccus pseudotrichonymphae]
MAGNKFIKSLMAFFGAKKKERNSFIKKEKINNNKNSKKISKNNKIISSILAVAMCCQPLVGAVNLPLAVNDSELVELKGNNNGEIKNLAVGIAGFIGIALLEVFCGKGKNQRIDLSGEDNESIKNQVTTIDEDNESIKSQVTTIGEEECGKSCLVLRENGKEFDQERNKTDYANFSTKTIKNSETNILFNNWDIKGNNEDIMPLYLKNAKIIRICFDLSKPLDQNQIVRYFERWVKIASEKAPNALMMFIGCKSDKKEENAPGYGEIIDNAIRSAISRDPNYCQIIIPSVGGNLFFETSALDGRGIKEVENAMVEAVLVDNYKQHQTQRD